MTKKSRGKSKVKAQPELPESRAGRKPAASAVGHNGETSPKTKSPQRSRNTLEAGAGMVEAEVPPVPKFPGTRQKPGVSADHPPLLISNNRALENDVKEGASPTRTTPLKSAEHLTLEIRPKVLRRFYEPIVLLDSLDRTRGARTKRPIDTGDLEHSKRERRRDLTDAIAYICAFNTGGELVTAAALENTPQGITVWLAANSSNAGESVLVFLRDILADLVDIQDRTKTESRIFSKVVKFNKPRVQTYWGRAEQRIAPCLKVIRGSNEFKGRDELIQWLEVELASCAKTEESLVRECYSAARDGPHRKHFDAIERFIGDGKTQSDNFEMLRYHICRLGKHLAITKRMVTTSIRDRALFSGFEVKLLDSPKPKVCTLVPKKTTLEGIFGRMFSNTTEKEALLEPLRSISDALGLPERLQKNCKFNIRVHAELLLVDHFYTQKLDFVDGDKYIGCSKPACFLCYQYISAHPGGFALPATHQKLYTCWRHPDDLIGRDDSETLETLRKFREDIINEMTKKIRSHLSEQIREGIGQRKPHPDSSTGVSTYLASQVP